MNHFPTSILSPLILILILILTLIHNCQYSDPESGYPLFLFNCSKDGNYTPYNMYQYSLFNLLGNLSSHAASPNSTGFYYTTIGQGDNQVYASYLCRGDVSHSTCSQCVTNATNTVVTTCPYQLGAAIWYIECMFQYSATPYWGVIQDRFNLKVWNSSRNMSDSQAAEFGSEVDGALGGVATLAANDVEVGMMYATWEGNGLYTLAQCRPDLSREDCVACLKETIGNVTRGMIDGMVIFPSCNIRFETYRFYAMPIPGSGRSDASKKECLNWGIRFKIICGIAKGILYLYDDSRLKIIHHDLKSSNIFSDEAMNRKIFDFCLARLFGVDQTQDDTNRIVGTNGYMAPEYAQT